VVKATVARSLLDALETNTAVLKRGKLVGITNGALRMEAGSEFRIADEKERVAFVEEVLTGLARLANELSDCEDEDIMAESWC
jgi:hypothetical protein